MRANVLTSQSVCVKRIVSRPHNARRASRWKCLAVATDQPLDVLGSEGLQQWNACKSKLAELGVADDEVENVLKESFAWNGQQYWADEKVLLESVLQAACIAHLRT